MQGGHTFLFYDNPGVTSLKMGIIQHGHSGMTELHFRTVLCAYSECIVLVQYRVYFCFFVFLIKLYI